MSNQFHFDPESYLDLVRSEIPDYDSIQQRLATLTKGDVRRVLDLGCGTGETARAVLREHPGAVYVGVDENEAMMERARRLVPDGTFVKARLQDPLPTGSFDLVVSAFAIHHLDGEEKAELFSRVSEVVVPGGRFVIADVVAPVPPGAVTVPRAVGYDKPSTVEDQLSWLHDVGLDPGVAWARDDLAVLVATRRGWVAAPSV